MAFPNFESHQKLPTKSQQVSVIKRTDVIPSDHEPVDKRIKRNICDSNSEDRNSHVFKNEEHVKSVKDSDTFERRSLETTQNVVLRRLKKDSVLITKSKNSRPHVSDDTRLASSVLLCNESPLKCTTVKMDAAKQSCPEQLLDNSPRIADSNEHRAFQETARCSSTIEVQATNKYPLKKKNCQENPQALPVIKLLKAEKRLTFQSCHYKAETSKQSERIYKENPGVATNKLVVQPILKSNEKKEPKRVIKVMQKKPREGRKGRRNYSRVNAWNGPSYTDLITEAISSAPDRKMIVAQIYDWLIQNISYFNQRQKYELSQGWKVR